MRYTTSQLIACLAASLGMGTIAVALLPKLVATAQWFPAGCAAFVVFASTIGAGVSIVELIAEERRAPVKRPRYRKRKEGR